ncbi:MAG: bifunctional alpha/beta hydrolase/class I SAM-dependent methyltransferase [Gemmataceae bacterium]
MLHVQERLQTPAALEPSEHTLTLRDGTELFYRAWLPERPATKALILFHRGHEHSGRWQETVAALGLEDVAVFAWDQRGHGHSSGARGSAPDLATVIRDADEWVRHLLAEHDIAPQDTIVLAHSLGAVIATAWVHDYAPPLRGLILATPAFRVKLYVPFAVPFLRLRQKLLGPSYVTSYVKANMLTHDAEQARRYNADPLIFREIAVNMLLDLHDTSTRLLDDAAAITVPLLVLAAGSDWVVQQSAQRRFVERSSSSIKQFEVLPGFSHAVFHEKDRGRIVEKVRDFILDRFAQPSSSPSLLDADRQGFTHDEYDRLCGSGGSGFAPLRWLMKGPGRLSRGIHLGWKHGFDSGIMLDYIYENRARGVTPLGRLIDRFYLNAIGWRGIRVRRALLEQTLRSTIEQTHAEGRPVRLLDIASGPGRYILETMARLRTIPVSAVLRDYKPENREAAARLRDQLGLAHVVVTAGDAFDRDALAAVTPRPSIALVSGLYELFADNERVLRSLRGLADALEPGGHLLYTNQPWHPQLEFIARVLTNREGQPWIMRRRTQAEMDELVRAAGFDKVLQETDPWGIFTVSVARRVR